MSDATFGAGTGDRTRLHDLERRLIASSFASPTSLQDQLDWADQLMADGALGEGRLLIQSAAIQAGVSSQLTAVFARLDPTSGAPTALSSSGASPGTTVSLAMAELRTLSHVVGPSMAERVGRGPTRPTFSPDLHPVADLSKAAPQPSERPLRPVVAELSAWLRASEPEAAETERAGALIDMLRGASGLDRQAADRFAAAPHGISAEILVLTSLRRFLWGASDLLHGPLGSIELFHATARLDSNGLGPYFSNVGQIARRSRDLFELAGVAALASSLDASAGLEQAWVALMSRGLSGGALEEVVDDLGDRQASFALEVILRRVLQSLPDEIDLALVKRIRDAALDNLAFPLAAHAQRFIVDLKPEDILERMILGGIDASGGRFKAAEDSFVACIAEAPEDEDIRVRLDAVRMRRFEPYAVSKGFGSPPDRQLHRLRCRFKNRASPASPD